MLSTALHHLVYTTIPFMFTEEEYLHCKPSQLAAAAVCATRVYCQFHNAWGPKLQEITSYSLEDLSPIVSSLLRFVSSFHSLHEEAIMNEHNN